MCKIYIINLASSLDRRARMELALGQLKLENYEFISAIDGRKMSAADVNEKYNCKKSLDVTGRGFSRGEVGCALSHQKAYRTLLGSDSDYALILEDDIELSVDTPEVLELIREWLVSSEPRVLLLTSLKGFCTKPSTILNSKYRMVDVKKAWWGMGYVINKAAAEKLIEVNGEVWLMADDWVEYKRNAGIMLKGVDPWLIKPAPEVESILEKDRKSVRAKKHRTWKYRAKKIRENVLLKIVEYFFWRPFKGYKRH